jgi:hypothetical protein
VKDVVQILKVAVFPRRNLETAHPSGIILPEHWFSPTMTSENKRTLKIEAVGDFASRKIKPQIRLSGRWLEQAGFKPGHRVTIHSFQPGELTLQFKESADTPQ